MLPELALTYIGNDGSVNPKLFAESGGIPVPSGVAALDLRHLIFGEFGASVATSSDDLIGEPPSPVAISALNFFRMRPLPVSLPRGAATLGGPVPVVIPQGPLEGVPWIAAFSPVALMEKSEWKGVFAVRQKVRNPVGRQVEFASANRNADPAISPLLNAGPCPIPAGVGVFPVLNVAPESTDLLLGKARHSAALRHTLNNTPIEGSYAIV